MKKVSLYLVLAMLANLNAICQNVYNYEVGETSIRLGSGWSPKEPMTNKIISGFFERVDETGLNINASDQFSQGFVENFTEFEKKTKLSIDASGKTTVGVFKVSGDASFEQQREIFRNERKIVWIISGKRTYDPFILEDIKLTATGKSELENAKKNNDFNSFVKAAGTHIVTSITKASEINLIYVFTVSNTSLKEKLRTAISAQANGGVTEGNVKVSFIEELKKVDNNLDYQVFTSQTGINDNSPALSNIISIAPGDISEVRKQLDLVVKSFSWQRAKITEFKAEPLATALNFNFNDNFDYTSLSLKINRIKQSENKIVIRYLTLSDLLNSASNHNLKLKPGAENQIKLELDSLLKSFDLCENIIKNIQLEPTKTTIPNIDIKSNIIDWLILDFGSFLRWEYEVNGNSYNEPGERIYANIYFWPVFNLNADYIKRFEIIENSIVVLSLSNSQIALKFGQFNSKDFYKIFIRKDDYCWRGDAGKCNSAAASPKFLANEQKLHLEGKIYKYRITDTENNVYEFDLSNPSKQDFQ